MLLAAALGCAIVCLAAGLATVPAREGAGGPAPGALVLAGVQVVGGALLGWAIGWLLAMTPAETAALALLGASPGTVAVNPLVALAGGRIVMANGVTAVGGLAAVAAVAAVALLFGAAGSVVLPLLLAAALPMWLGRVLRLRVSPGVQRLAPIVAGLALAAMVLAGLILGRAGATIWPLAGAVLLLAGALTVLGHAVGRGLVPVAGGDGVPVTAALLLPMRNVAVPMLAGLAGGLSVAPLAAALYGVLMYVPALALVMARQARARR